ncbi:MAG: ribosome biogenesis GTPase YlqF [Clostridiales bacterium]|nr:ribosome biogenesis GTPase YlqF [Clostridiales bacterium]
MDIQWYPGHMTKTRRMMEENIALVDIVAELVDARIPLSSKNPDIDKLAANKKRLIILNKADLADSRKTELWREYFEDRGFRIITADSKAGKGIKEIYPACREIMREKIERLKARGRILVPSRVMIAGIPNVGKSTLINRLVGRSLTKTGDKPGVTRSKQWVKIKKDLELLDTPGILWPKFDDEAVGLRLAFTGAINDDILEKNELAVRLTGELVKLYPGCLSSRYWVSEELSPHEIFENIGKNRGFLTKGGEIDSLRTASVFLDEFRGGKLGRITLEMP